MDLIIPMLVFGLFLFIVLLILIFIFVFSTPEEDYQRKRVKQDLKKIKQKVSSDEDF
jgi:preprotein translocase subunit YajC